MRAYVWSAIVAGLAFLLFVELQRPQVFSSNVLDLLPTTEQDEVVENAINAFTKKVGQKSLFLIGSDDLKQAKQAAEVFHKSLIHSQVFDELVFRIDEAQQKKYRYSLFSFSLPFT